MVSTILRLVEVAPRSSIPVSAGASTVSVTRHILGRLNWRAAVGNKLPVNFGLHPFRRLTAAEASTGHLHRQARQSHGQSLRIRPRLWSIMAVLGLMAAWGSGVPTASAQPQIVESASDYEDCVAHVRASGLPKEAVAVGAQVSGHLGMRRPFPGAPQARRRLHLFRFHAEPAFRHCRTDPDQKGAQADRSRLHPLSGRQKRGPDAGGTAATRHFTGRSAAEAARGGTPHRSATDRGAIRKSRPPASSAAACRGIGYLPRSVADLRLDPAHDPDQGAQGQPAPSADKGHADLAIAGPRPLKHSHCRDQT